MTSPDVPPAGYATRPPPPPPPPPPPADAPVVAEEVAAAARTAHAILDEVERAVIGKRDVLALVLAGLLADGHVLLDDLPGVAKTLIARSLATAAGLDFSRVQFTPDLLPADITGSLVLDLATQRPEFRPGPVFANLVLADEINRAPAKTQAALLEAMQERQITVDGITHRLPRPFLVIATQNPIESRGHLPAARGPARPVHCCGRDGLPGGPTRSTMLRAPDRPPHRGDRAVAGATSPASSPCSRRSSRCTSTHRSLDYVVALVAATRADADLAVGASPRGSLALWRWPGRGRCWRARPRRPRRPAGPRRAGAGPPRRPPGRGLGRAHDRRPT